MPIQIALVEDGPGSYRFTFMTTRGELSGRVTVGSKDRRTGGLTRSENRPPRIRFSLSRGSFWEHAETEGRLRSESRHSIHPILDNPQVLFGGEILLGNL